MMQTRYLLSSNENLMIIHGSRDKPQPSFANIKALLLPYEDLSTTIAFPLVLLEACLEGCTVFTTAKVLAEEFEFPQLVFTLGTFGN